MRKMSSPFQSVLRQAFLISDMPFPNRDGNQILFAAFQFIFKRLTAGMFLDLLVSKHEIGTGWISVLKENRIVNRTDEKRRER